jgi:hypothetical protein
VVQHLISKARNLEAHLVQRETSEARGLEVCLVQNVTLKAVLEVGPVQNISSGEACLVLDLTSKARDLEM